MEQVGIRLTCSFAVGTDPSSPPPFALHTLPDPPSYFYCLRPEWNISPAPRPRCPLSEKAEKLLNSVKKCQQEVAGWTEIHPLFSLSLCVMKLFIVHSHTDVQVRYTENRSIVNTMLTLWGWDIGTWVLTHGVTSSNAKLWNCLYDYEGAWVGFQFQVGQNFKT